MESRPAGLEGYQEVGSIALVVRWIRRCLSGVKHRRVPASAASILNNITKTWPWHWLHEASSILWSKELEL